jgi:hypothetical protein
LLVVDDVHGKKLGSLAPEKMSFSSVDKLNVLLTTFKLAEDGDRMPQKIAAIGILVFDIELFIGGRFQITKTDNSFKLQVL